MLRKWIVVLCLHLSVGVAFAAPMSDAAKIEQGEKFYQSGKRYLDARNEDAAFRAFKRAAFLGHVGGMRLLAVCYLEGIGCWVDTDEAAYWLEYAANSGDGFSAFELAKIHFERRRQVKGIDMLQKAAEAFAQLNDQQGLVDCAQLAMDIGANDLAVAIYEISSGTTTKQETPPQYGGTGTAWFVNKTDVVTCNHVIEGCKTFALIGENNQKIGLRVVARDETNDLAVLRVTSSRSSKQNAALPIKMYSELSVRKGGSCFTLGYPQPGIQGVSCKYTEGKINALEGVQGSKQHYQISAEIHPGNSGGPLFNVKGEVIGVIVARLRDSQNVNYAIKGKVLLDFLTKNRIAFEKSVDTKAFSSVEDLVEIKEQSVFLIEAKP